MQSHKKTEFPQVSEKQHLEILKIDGFSVFFFGFLFLFLFYFSLFRENSFQD